MQINSRGIGLFLLASALAWIGCESQQRQARQEGPAASPLAELLRAPASIPRQDGTAAVILVDTSGSMQQTVPDADGQARQKIEIARRAAANLLQRFVDYAQKNPGRPLLVGIYEFSSRGDQPYCRPVIKLGPPPNIEAARLSLDSMIPDGATPIGDAMIAAKRDLDATGMTKCHILVITDGENNRGYSPGAVARYMSTQPEEVRAAIYFIAFDVEAAKFNAVKESGGLVLAAANEKDLNQTLDFILSGKILVEQPVTSPPK